jgi:hypothetical protein
MMVHENIVRDVHCPRRETMSDQTPPSNPNRPIISFAAGTPILTADGYKRIEDIKPGDVIQGSPAAGEVCDMFVTRQPIFSLHLNGQVIHTTPDQPFYVKGRGWVNAAELLGAESEGEKVIVPGLNLGERDAEQPNDGQGDGHQGLRITDCLN